MQPSMRIERHQSPGRIRFVVHRASWLLGALLMHALTPSAAPAGIAGLERVASGLSSPMFVTHAPGDRTRLFIGQRGGTVRIVDLTTGELSPTPFLSIPSIDTAGEGGLLGMAFHPDYAVNGKFYTYTTHDNGGIVIDGETSPFSSHIREYTVSANPNVANAGFTPVLNFVQPQSNHNGGWIGFSPNDNYLYIMSGDGGGGGDRDDDGDDNGHTPGIGNAQDKSKLLGKVLRLNVNGDDFPADTTRNYSIPLGQGGNPFAPDAMGGADPDGANEIWAYGLRNPYRASFDRATGDLWIGDVGQGSREEIDYQPADSDGGENYGWRLREGLNPFNGGGKPADNVDPVYDYGRTGTFGGKTVIGGYVYRGPDPELQGQYFFADSGDFGNAASNKFWTLDSADIPPVFGSPELTPTDIKSLLTPNTGTPRFPVAFGEDAIGNLYIVYYETNQVYRIVTDALTPGDFAGDADVDADDLALWQAGFGMEVGAGPDDGDADGDGDVDGQDFLAWQQNLGWSPLNVGAPVRPVPEPTGTAIVMAAVGTACCIKARDRRVAAS